MSDDAWHNIQNAHKEQWIRDWRFYSSAQWGDPEPTYEEAEAAWQEYYKAWALPPDKDAVELLH